MRGDPVLSRCTCGAQVWRPPEGERPIRMEHVPFCTVNWGRKCAWCGGPMVGKSARARCCQKSCKAALWKYERGYGHQKPQEQCSYTKPSGLQYSRRRAVLALAFYFAHEGMGWSDAVYFRPSRLAIREAERILDRALPARQRERLAQRSKEAA